MEVDLDYDLGKKKNLKDVRLFLSIAPDKIDVNNNIKNQIDLKENIFINKLKFFNVPTMHFPNKNFFTQDKTKYIVENKEYFLNFYRKEKETFHEILSNTFIVISTDRELTSYNKAIANFVKISYGTEFGNCDSPTEESSLNQTEEEDNTIFITNYTLVKKLYEEDLKDVKVYMLPKEKECEVESLFKKLDYIVGFIQDKFMRNDYFTDVISKFKLRRLEINERFLKIRNEFLRFFDKKNKSEIFKDPIKKEMVFPVLNIMVLNFSKDEIYLNFNKDEYHVNTIDFKFYESGFIQKFQKNMVNSDITFVAYLDSDEIFGNSKEIWKEFLLSPRELFIDKNISINFGKIEKIEELGCGYYNFMKSCSGSMIYCTKFMPLGITTIKKYNLSILKNSSINKSDSAINSNIFLPFSNKAVISIFKKFMNIDFKHHIDPPKEKEKLFTVQKPGLLNENKTFLNEYFSKSEFCEPSNNNFNTNNLKSTVCFYESKCEEFSEKEKNIKSLKNSYFFNNLTQEHSTSDFDKSKLNKMNRIVTEKLKNKSFNYAPFNRILEDRSNFNNSLAHLIDITISNLFK